MPILTPQQHEKEMHSAASSGNWDKAIEHAKLQPKNWSAFDKLPQYNIPPEAFEKVINAVPKSERPSFYFELASNLHPDLSHDQLDLLGSKTGDDSYVQERIQSHPNWNPKESKKNLSEKVASDFWLSYERRVEPHHFAVIKSLISGKPEEITDHRGKTGHSHLGSIQNGRLYEKETNLAPNGPRFYGEQFLANLKDVHPHILNHAKKVQDAILQDENIEKKTINGKPHIKLYRGLGGSYSKRIAKASKYDPKDHTVENKRFKVKSAPFSSWSTEKEIADTFAKRRSESIGVPGPAKPGESVTVSSWVPVENILHSGFHRIHTGQEHAHPQESEIIVSHPTGYMNLDSKDLHFIDTAKDPYSSETKNVSIKRFKPQKLAASEKEYFTDLLEKSIKSKLATAALGASLLTTPVSTEPKQKAYKEESVMLHPDLVSISAIESNYGKNKKHRKVLHGVNLGHTAAGATGLMPLTVKDTVKRNKDLAERYPQTISMNHDDLTDFINKNPGVENKIANTHYNRLLKIFGKNKNRAAYAWRNGITAAKSKSDNEIANDPYVKAVNSVKKAENYFENLKKTNTWQSEGYKIEHHPADVYEGSNPGFKLVAKDKSGNIVGQGHYVDKPKSKNIWCEGIHVDEEHQNKGIGKAMHSMAEKVSNKPFKTKAKERTQAGKSLYESFQRQKAINKSQKYLYFQKLNKNQNKKFIAVAHKGMLSNGNYNPSQIYYVGRGLYMDQPYHALSFNSVEEGRKHLHNAWKEQAKKNDEYKQNAPHPFDISFIEDTRPGKWNEDESYYEDQSGNPILDREGSPIHAKIPTMEVNEPGSVKLHIKNPRNYTEVNEKRKIASHLGKQGKKVEIVYPKEPKQTWGIKGAKELHEQENLMSQGYSEEEIPEIKAKSKEKTSKIPLAASEKEFKSLNKSHDKYFIKKLKKIDGAITTTIPPKPISQTGPSLNGTSLKEQPRGIKGNIKDAQQVSQSFQGNLGMPAISSAAQRIKGFFK